MTTGSDPAGGVATRVRRAREVAAAFDRAEHVAFGGDALRRPARAGRRLRVMVLTPGVGGRGGISRMMDSVSEELDKRPSDVVSVNFVSTRSDVTPPLRPFVFAQAILRVAAACVSRRCDVLHVNVASNGSTFRKIILATIAAATRTPYVVHLHGADYARFWATRGRWSAGLVNTFFRRAARVVVLGKSWSRLVQEHVPEAARRLVILPNATPTPPPPDPARPKDPVVILFLGRLTADKGLPQLIDALASLAGLPSWRAVLAGNGDMQSVRDLVRTRGLQDRVEIPGWAGPAEVDRLLRSAHIFVLPSFAENLPVSIIEAFAYRVPVICTPVGAVPEMVEHGRTGLMVPAGDVTALAEALRRLITDAGLRETLADNASAEHAARYQLSSYVDRLAEVWVSATGQDGRVRTRRSFP